MIRIPGAGADERDEAASAHQARCLAAEIARVVEPIERIEQLRASSCHRHSLGALLSLDRRGALDPFADVGGQKLVERFTQQPCERRRLARGRKRHGHAAARDGAAEIGGRVCGIVHRVDEHAARFGRLANQRD